MRGCLPIEPYAASTRKLPRTQALRPFTWPAALAAACVGLARRAWRHSVWRSAGTFRTGIDQARTMAASSILGPARVSVGICWVLRSRGPLVHRDRTDRLIAWFNWIASLLGSQPVGAC